MNFFIEKFLNAADSDDNFHVLLLKQEDSDVAFSHLDRVSKVLHK